MTDDKKHEDKDRKKVSDEEMEAVAGGFSGFGRPAAGDIKEANKGKGKKKKPGKMENFTDISALDTFYEN